MRLGEEKIVENTIKEKRANNSNIEKPEKTKYFLLSSCSLNSIKELSFL